MMVPVAGVVMAVVVVVLVAHVEMTVTVVTALMIVGLVHGAAARPDRGRRTSCRRCPRLATFRARRSIPSTPSAATWLRIWSRLAPRSSSDPTNMSPLTPADASK